MAADAISVSETTYLTAVLYYITNLGTTVESQVRSFVALPVSLLHYSPLSKSISSQFSSPLSRASLCAVLPSPLNTKFTLRLEDDQVAARQSRTHILAVTSDLTFF